MTDPSPPTRPPSWYADPTGRHQYRYWNGTEWTDQVADNQQTSTDPPTMPAGGAAPSAPPAGVAPGPLPDRATRRSPKPLLCWITALGGVVLAIGAFLDAVTGSAGAGGFEISIDQSYMDGDGPIELVLGIGIVAIAVLLAFNVFPWWTAWIAAGLGLVGAVVAIADVIDVMDKIDELESLGGSGSVGVGLWVCLAGGVVAVGGGMLAAITSTEPSA